MNTTPVRIRPAMVAVLALVAGLGLLLPASAVGEPVSPNSPTAKAVLAVATADAKAQLRKPVRLAEPKVNGAKSFMYAGLFRRSGQRWARVDSAVGPSDVAWTGWDTKYGAPSSIFAL